MKKEEKIKIIKYFISEQCALGKIQTEKDKTNNIKELEMLVANDRAYPHYSKCCTCYYENKDYSAKCIECCKSNELMNYTFPYGYWKKVYERNFNK